MYWKLDVLKLDVRLPVGLISRKKRQLQKRYILLTKENHDFVEIKVKTSNDIILHVILDDWKVFSYYFKRFRATFIRFQIL